MKRNILADITADSRIPFKKLLLLILLILITGCVSEKVEVQNVITSYQKTIVEKSPQPRDSQKGLESLRPIPEPNMLELKVTKDKRTGKNIIELTIEDAVRRTLISSPEISITSYDPSIAKEDIIKAASDFDVTLFGRLNYEKEDNPTDSIFQGGQSTSRIWETGFKQKGTTGAEWSLAYALTRNWDDMTTRTLSTRYEPMLSFQIKQPLLRDAWQELNLAGVNIAPKSFDGGPYQRRTLSNYYSK